MESENTPLQAALLFHQAGNYKSAEPLYREILKHEPNHVDANCLLGTLFMQIGRFRESEQFLRHAVILQPEHHIARNNLGHTLHGLGNIEAAISEYEKAVGIYPQFSEALNNLGCAKYETGLLAESAEIFQRILQFNPRYAAAHFNLGLVQHEQNDTAAAIGSFKNAIRLDKKYFDAWTHLGHVYFQLMAYKKACFAYEQANLIRPLDSKLAGRLGTAYWRNGAKIDAVRMFERAVTLDQNSAEAWVNLSQALTQSGRFQDAVEAGKKTIALHPDNTEGYISFVVALYNNGEYQRARDIIENTLQRWPHNIQALKLLATIQHRSNDPRALESYDALIGVHADDAVLHWNRALLCLSRGDIANGWDEYEWGLKTKGRPGPKMPSPHWNGEPLEGKVIVAVREQGMGDELMFSSCIPDLVEVARKVIFVCDPRFVELFRRSFAGCEVIGIERGASLLEITKEYHPDYYVRVGSLPRYFRRTLDSFPNREAYVIPEISQLNNWKGWLASLGSGLKVGICWRSGLSNPLRDTGSTTVEEWSQVFAVKNITWVNLQYGDCEAELRRAESLYGIKIHRPPDLDQFNELDKLTALAAALDMVVTAGTSVHVVSGAVGTATLMLGRAPIMSLGTPTEPWFKRVEQIPEHEKAITLRFAARCLEQIVSLCGDKRAVNEVFTRIVRDTLDVSVERPVIFVSNDGQDIESIVWREYGEFCSAEEECFARYIPLGGAVLEVGASVGIQTVKLAKYAGRQGHIRAVEANPRLWAVLRENIVANRILNVEILNHTVGYETYAIPIPRYGWNSNERVDDNITVDVAALNNMANRRIDFVRVAGVDRHMSVLRSATRLLQVDRTVFYLIDAPIDEVELYTYLSEMGYRWQRHIVPWVSASNSTVSSYDYYKNRMEYNLICIPQERVRESR